jgi:hypothetical protein
MKDLKDLAEYAAILGLIGAAWVLLYVTGYLVEKFIGFFTKEK